MNICNLASQLVPYAFSVYKFSLMFWSLFLELFHFKALISVYKVFNSWDRRQ